MPEQKTIERARKDKRAGKAPSTQAGEFVHEEIKHIREGKHGARSTKQAIAIGLSKARRAGVKLKAPKGTSARTRAAAARDSAKGRAASSTHKKAVSRTRSRATREALRHEGHSAASPTALSRQAHASAKKRGPSARSAAARKAARTRARRGT